VLSRSTIDHQGGTRSIAVIGVCNLNRGDHVAASGSGRNKSEVAIETLRALEGGRSFSLYPEVAAAAQDLSTAENVADSQCQMGNGRTGASSLDRYLIRVDRIGAKGQALKPVYFAPSAAVVERCSQVE
jgi:hypothetical protein